ncbi:Sulfate permease 2 [Terramyces sp. JEL0728]|nr:Sulfate permease 2 [Terramyces sp. JEL0728]
MKKKLLDLDDLTSAAPDWDAESDDDSENDEQQAREHYVQVGKSKLRDALEIPLDGKYNGKKITRKELSKQVELEGYEVDSDEELKFESDEELDFENNVSSEGDSEGSEIGDEEVDDNDELTVMSRLELQEQDEKAMLKKMSENQKTEIEKGQHVKAQLSLWDGILDLRVRIQKGVEAANTFPQHDVYYDHLNEDSIDENIQKTTSTLQGLLNNLVDMRMDLLDNSNEKIDVSIKRKRDEDDIDEWLHSTWEEVLKPIESGFKKYKYDTIEKWNNKVQVANSVTLQKKFKVINQSIVSQLQTIENDTERLVKRTQLNRGNYKTEQEQQPEETRDKHLNDYDKEIFDDGDYYQQLLKELIESRLTDTEDPVLLGMRYAQLKQLQNKKSKKNVDTKASKGRKIRYHVQEKIQNFMAPEPRGTWHEEMVEELFSGLLGRKSGNVDVPLQFADGFKLIYVFNLRIAPKPETELVESDSTLYANLQCQCDPKLEINTEARASLAYAKLAGLPVQYGLYTSFVGVVMYFLFATSKDVTIGPTAVLSQLSGQLLAANAKGLGIDIVSYSVSLAFITGVYQLAIGFLRLGIVVDLIPIPVIAGFTSGAAIQIIIGQIAGLFGIPNINTNDPAYLVLYNTCAAFNNINFDIVIGLSTLALIIIFRLATYFLVQRGHKWAIWIGQAANAVAIILFTLVSYGVNANLSKSKFKIVGTVPTGLNYIHVPNLNQFGSLASTAVSVLLVSVLEHVAVTKSFGRLNGYRADPNQEIVALGVTNVIGPFFGGFAATGSFSRSSIKSRSGVKTPAAGLITALIVLLAIYVITPWFYYIPSAALSAIIIAAITDLISRPALLVELWNIEFYDFLSFLIAFVITIFFSIETAIYSSVTFALLVVLYRVARPNAYTLVRDNAGGWIGVETMKQDDDKVDAVPPPPGILVFRIEEALTYPNSNYVNDYVVRKVESSTRYNGNAGVENQWNASPHKKTGHFDLPELKAVIFDLSAVNNIDSTGLQTLVDIRKEVEVHSGKKVPFYFAHARPHFQHILVYFLTLTDPTHDVAPILANASNPSLTKIHRDSTVSQIKEGDVQTNFAMKFIWRTIDQAVEAAQHEKEL